MTKTETDADDTDAPTPEHPSTIPIEGIRSGDGITFTYQDTPVGESPAETHGAGDVPDLHYGALLTHLHEMADRTRVSDGMLVGAVHLTGDGDLRGVSVRETAARSLGLPPSKDATIDGHPRYTAGELALRSGDAPDDLPVPLARCDRHGLVLVDAPNDPNARQVCVACEFDGVRADLARDPPGGGPEDREFRNRLDASDVEYLLPPLREFLDDVGDGECPIWVTQMKRSGDLPAGYTEQERFIPAIGFCPTAVEKYIITTQKATETVENLRENGYGSGGGPGDE
jgi:hypothetical protein